MSDRLHVAGALLLILAALALAWIGQPGPMEKWRFLAADLQPRLDNRDVMIDPGELMMLMHDDYIDLRIVDVREEHDWNLFHLWGAQRLEPKQIPEMRGVFSTLPENGVIVLVSNDEALSTEAWKLLMASAHRPNAYILAGGINAWLNRFAARDAAIGVSGNTKVEKAGPATATGLLRYPFDWALGSRHPAALPDPHEFEPHGLTKKVRLQKRVVKKGGCG